MEQRDGGDCTPEAPVSEADTASRVACWTESDLAFYAARAIDALEAYEQQLAGAYRRRQVESCIRIMQRVEASRTEPDWEPPAQPDWMVNPSDEELRRVSRSVTDDELERLR